MNSVAVPRGFGLVSRMPIQDHWGGFGVPPFVGTVVIWQSLFFQEEPNHVNIATPHWQRPLIVIKFGNFFLTLGLPTWSEGIFTLSISHQNSIEGVMNLLFFFLRWFLIRGRDCATVATYSGVISVPLPSSENLGSGPCCIYAILLDLCVILLDLRYPVRIISY